MPLQGTIQTINPTGIVVRGGGTPYVGPLDSYTANLFGAWSVNRLMVSSYSGALFRVRRDSDNTELDVGSTAEGLFDYDALTEFVGESGNGFVTKVYDQVSTNHRINTTAAGQPQIVAGGLPQGMNFDGSNDCLKCIPITGTLTAAFTRITTAQLLANGSFPMVSVIRNATLELRGNASTGNLQELYAGALTVSPALSFTASKRVAAWRQNNGPYAATVNNTATGSGASGAVAVPDVLCWGSRSTGAPFANCLIDEEVIFSADIGATDVTAIVAETMTHYGL